MSAMQINIHQATGLHASKGLQKLTLNIRYLAKESLHSYKRDACNIKYYFVSRKNTLDQYIHMSCVECNLTLKYFC